MPSVENSLSNLSNNYAFHDLLEGLLNPLFADSCLKLPYDKLAFPRGVFGVQLSRISCSSGFLIAKYPITIPSANATKKTITVSAM